MQNAYINHLLPQRHSFYPVHSFRPPPSLSLSLSLLQEMPVLAFVFDHLLPASSNQTSSVPALTKLAKTFLQCLATAHYSPDAISVLVTEFKMAFARALAMQESQLKHSRVRALMGLLSQILEYVMTSRGPVNPSPFARLLIRKGFISDLTRAIHSLNLSSTFLSATVNSILKPLEVLTRIVNQVATSQQRKMDSENKSASNSRPVTTTSQGSRQENETPVSQPETAPPPLAEGNSTITHTANVDSEQRTLERTDDSHPPSTANSQNVPVDESILEATHESLIPLEEEEEDEERREIAEGEMDANLIDQAVSLARELGRQTHELLTGATEGQMEFQVPFPLHKYIARTNTLHTQQSSCHSKRVPTSMKIITIGAYIRSLSLFCFFMLFYLLT